jgi:anti-anti-sigma regulatory factor
MTDKPVGAMRPGDHAAFCFATPEEQAQVIGAFLNDGLNARQKVIYLGRAGPRQLPGLHGQPDADQAAATGRLRIIPQDVAWLTRGNFDLDRLYTLVGSEIAAAGEQGYPAVRVTGDMSWLLSEPGGFPTMLACEAGFDEAIRPDDPVIALCQYDRNRCPPDQLSMLTHTHQLQVTANPEYDDGVLRIMRSNDSHGLQLAGELDAARHHPFMTALTSLGTTKTTIHLDFTDVRFVDLGTLRLLVTYAPRISPGCALVLDNLPPDVTAIIQTLGWHHFPRLIQGHSRPS